MQKDSTNYIPEKNQQFLSYQDWKDQAQFTSADLRKKVNDITQYPYKAIGRIHCKRKFSLDKQIEPLNKFGIGCLIHPRVVLTVVYVLHFDFQKLLENFQYKEFNGIADSVQFHHLSSNSIKKVLTYKYHQKYLDKNGSIRQLNDIAILILDQPVDIESNDLLILDISDLFIKNNPNTNSKILTIKVYPEVDKECICQQENNSLRFVYPKLKYKHTTKPGDSGTPILIKKTNEKYSIAGLHKAALANCNMGISINSFVKNNLFFQQVLKQYKIQTNNQNKPIININTFKLSLHLKYKLKQIKALQESNYPQIKILQIDTQNYQFIRFSFAGPSSSPYQDYWLQCKYIFPSSIQAHKRGPPTIIFTQRIWHPHVDSQNGKLCLNIQDWCVALCLQSIIYIIMDILSMKHIDFLQQSFVNPEAAYQLRLNYQYFYQQAKLYCKRYCMYSPFYQKYEQKQKQTKNLAEGDELIRLLRQNRIKPFYQTKNKQQIQGKCPIYLYHQKRIQQKFNTINPLLSTLPLAIQRNSCVIM